MRDEAARPASGVETGQRIGKADPTVETCPPHERHTKKDDAADDRQDSDALNRHDFRRPRRHVRYLSAPLRRRRRCWTSPTMPRRKGRTQSTKMTPWRIVTQEPNCAREFSIVTTRKAPPTGPTSA